MQHIPLHRSIEDDCTDLHGFSQVERDRIFKDLPYVLSENVSKQVRGPSFIPELHNLINIFRAYTDYHKYAGKTPLS